MTTLNSSIALSLQQLPAGTSVGGFRYSYSRDGGAPVVFETTSAVHSYDASVSGTYVVSCTRITTTGAPLGTPVVSGPIVVAPTVPANMPSSISVTLG